MWREPRWIAIFLALTLFGSPSGHATNMRRANVRSAQDIRVFSAVADNAGSSVLLNTQKSGQLPFPLINYLPGPGGKIMMTVDFSGAQYVGAPAVFNFDQSQIRQVRVGQLQAFPPVMRLCMVADSREAFNKVAFRSSPGSLSINLPAAVEVLPLTMDKQIVRQTMPPTAPPIKSAPSPAPQVVSHAHPAPVTAPTPAPPAQRPGLTEHIKAVAPHAQGPASDARYIAMESLPAEKKKAVEVAPKPAPPIAATRNSAARAAAAPTPVVAPSPAAKPPTTESSQEPPAAPTADSEDWLTISASGINPISLQLTASRPFTYKSFRLRDPDRLVIDISGINKPPLIAAPELSDNNLAKAIRVGSPQDQPDVTRVVVDLLNGQVAANEALDRQTLTIQLTGSDIALTRTHPATGQIRPGSTVVLDAGHGGSDPGAQRGDIQEKELTLAIVDKLRKELEHRGLKVRLTRSDDSYVSLEDRVKITNNLQPDAFISVHINSLEANNKITGIETYYQNDRSRALAQSIHDALVSGLKVPDRSVRKARFYVINHTPVPAILAEVGFISNKEERDRLSSADYQRQVATALADGLVTFLAKHPGVDDAEPIATETERPKASLNGSGSESGTNSGEVASASGQSFLTQNLHSPSPKQLAENLKFKKAPMATRKFN